MSSVAAHPTGLGSYATRICDHIVRHYACSVLAPPHLALPDGVERIAVPGAVAIGKKARSRFAHLLNLARRQAFYLKGPFGKDDFVYSPTHHGFFNTKNQIVTIHDLIGLHYPENFPRQTRFFRSVMPRLIARSRAVFVVSEFTRREVLQFFDVDAGKVFVVPNTFDCRGVQVARAEDKRDFLLVVGCHLPHKNIEAILDVAALWSDRYVLKIVGATGYYGDRIRARVRDLRLDDKVEFLPFVAEADLDLLYRQAAALLYPSTIEGFGLPPLEALARGTLPIVSDIPVHREVLGEAAVFVTLGDDAAWAAAFDVIETRSAALAASPARHDVLDRYSAETVGRHFDAALLSVAPDLRCLRR